MNIESLIEKAREQRGSDVHLVQGLPPKCRVDGSIQNLEEDRLDKEQCLRFAHELVGEDFPQLEQAGEVDLARTIAGVRCRINVFRQQGAYSAAIRLLNDHIPPLEELGLPPVAQEFCSYHQGLVLITGETGSGKSTTLASLLDRINHTKPVHILTLEDPVEYIYTPDQSLINQREIGRDTMSFAAGLRAALREDPDVILVGEMRDLDTIQTALTAAETGHLVFGTVHTNSAADSIDRIVDVFPAERQQQQPAAEQRRQGQQNQGGNKQPLRQRGADVIGTAGHQRQQHRAGSKVIEHDHAHRRLAQGIEGDAIE